jgi:hypothetical protein
MRWWFAASDHQVQIVLVAKVDRAERRIILEKWLEARPGPGSGPNVTTGAADVARALRPERMQEIIITWAPGMANSPASHVVTRGDLQLEFDLLFLRPPGPAEGNIIITVSRLQMWAFTVWEAVI